MKRGVSYLAVAAAMCCGVAAAGPDLFYWGTSGGDLQTPVEQQSPLPWDDATNVVNPTVCSWDVDDLHYIGGGGNLTANQPETATVCLIADGSSYDGPYANNKTVYATALSPSGDLDVTLTNSLGQTWPADKVYYPSNHRWSYTVCTVDLTGRPFTNWADTYPEIPESNGGRGIRVDYTITVTAAKKQKATAEIRVQGGGC